MDPTLRMLHGGSDPMDATINLFDHLLSLGRRYQELGRWRDAANALGTLAGFPSLPAAQAEEVQARLGELALKRKRYRRARRHLTAALMYSPDNAHYHYLLAAAWRADDQGNDDRAAEHYRRSLELEPDQVKCLGELGLLLIRTGENEEGLGCLRKAATLAPADGEAAARLVKGLRLTGHGEEARSTARAALFSNPRSPRFRQLWRDSQFKQVLREQAAARRLRRRAAAGEDGGPRLLPFVRLVREGEENVPQGMRHDGPATVSPPHFPRPRGGAFSSVLGQASSYVGLDAPTHPTVP